jgi:hypothetical protein
MPDVLPDAQEAVRTMLDGGLDGVVVKIDASRRRVEDLRSRVPRGCLGCPP